MNQPFNPNHNRTNPNANGNGSGSQPQSSGGTGNFGPGFNPFRPAPDSHPATAPQPAVRRDQQTGYQSHQAGYPTTQQPVHREVSQPVDPQPMNPQWGQPQPAASSANALKKVLAFVVFMLIGVICVMGYMMYQSRQAYLANYHTTPQQAQTLVAPPPEAPNKNTENPARTTANKPARPTKENFRQPLPIPVNEAAKRGEPAGNFTKVFRSEKASAPFAMEVANQWRAKTLGSRSNYNTTVIAYSSITSQSYVMSCVDEGSYIHCSGGNDAHVYIS
ncbi:MAG: hypothetical protein Q4A31_01720 [Corynebacterium sp.]|uniref:hypothetical protein n=1 Tax=Corynebacterium sp. TaxID=1720 RepID=UPI0026DB8D93|nr:hypothetical protein [Corynebacterium sp.]MDO4760624.1 hypothetical protein [Corynebacterium sp.]